MHAIVQRITDELRGLVADLRAFRLPSARSLHPELAALLIAGLIGENYAGAWLGLAAGLVTLAAGWLYVLVLGWELIAEIAGAAQQRRSLAVPLSAVIAPACIAVVATVFQEARRPASVATLAHDAAGPASLLVSIALIEATFAGIVLWRRHKRGGARAVPTAAPAQAQAAAPRWRARAPRTTWAAIIGIQETKDRLLEAARAHAEENKNGILLYGPPGSGKTSVAEALASHMGRRILAVSIGDVTSKWIGEGTQNLVALFDAAKRAAPCVLFFDEIDALIHRQQESTHEESQRLVREFLTQIVNLRDTPVLFVGATNHLDQLDETAIREGRFDVKIEIPLPDAAAREGLARAKLAAEGRTIDEALLARMVRHWAGFNVPRIQLIVEKACRDTPAGQAMDYAAFHRALRTIQGHAAMNSPKAKKIDDLILDPAVRENVEVLAARLARTDEIMAEGGNAPTGAILTGPPGTGKTTLAASIAKASDRTFIATTGAELMKQGELDRIIARASDFRPSIIFIDEGDEILADRGYSNCAHVTNQLLVFMDGAGEGKNLADVAWIVAANHPERMDPAALRGGRLEVKIELGLPAPEAVAQLLRDWAQRNPTRIDGDVAAWIAAAAPLVAGLSPADIGSILDNAMNRTIARRVIGGGAFAPVTLPDLEAARREVAGS